jgi:putative transposase
MQRLHRDAEDREQHLLDLDEITCQGARRKLAESLEAEVQDYLDAARSERDEDGHALVVRNGHYTRNLVTPAGKIERHDVPRDREGEFVTEVFERYKRMTGDVEEAILEMYLSGISVRKIAGVTEALSRVRVGKDAVSRIARRLEEQQRQWRERSLEERSYPYLYLDATYLKLRWARGSRAWLCWPASGWTRRILGKCWQSRLPPRRRGRSTPPCCGVLSTGAFQE